MSENVKFTDGNGNPVSHEYFESVGYTKGLELPGQILIMIKTKKGALATAAMVEEFQDLQKLITILWKEYQKENTK